MCHADKQSSHQTVTPQIEIPAPGRKMSNLILNLSTTKRYLSTVIFFVFVQIENKKNQGPVNIKCFYVAFRF